MRILPDEVREGARCYFCCEPPQYAARPESLEEREKHLIFGDVVFACIPCLDSPLALEDVRLGRALAKLHGIDPTLRRAVASAFRTIGEALAKDGPSYPTLDQAAAAFMAVCFLEGGAP